MKLKNFRLNLANDKRGILHILIVLIVMLILAFGIIAQFAAIGTKVGEKDGGSGNYSDEMTATLDGLTMPATEGKLGSEEHVPSPYNEDGKQATDFMCMSELKHSEEADSAPLTYPGDWPSGEAGNCAAYRPHTTDQERWYFNMRWPSGEFKHKKVIIVNPKNNKKIVASIEEYGPAEWVTERDGINCGASPEVRNFLGTGSAYTGNPSDDAAKVQFGFAKDQNIPLGPLE